MKTKIVALLAAQIALPMAAHATNISGLTWQAQSTIVGQTSTATQAPPTAPGTTGNPIYNGGAQYSGVVALIMNEGAAGNFICSGTLLPDRRSILTAGHCVSHGAGTANPITTTAYFNPGLMPDSVVTSDAASTAITVSRYFVNPQYTGEVIDQNDIAVLRLSDFAPAYALSYDIDTAGDLTGQDYNVAGYGRRSDQGGSVGANLGTGRLRQGDNRYDFRLGDADFDGFFDGGANGFFGKAKTFFSYVSDFDDGLSQNDASCRLAVDGFGLAPSAKYCNTGIGPLEVSTAGGDSGGPQFVNGRIASVTSYGLTFGTDFGDIDNANNSTFGEFNGFVPTFIHQGFIAHAQSAPEPNTWMQMILGFGAVGGSLRVRRRRSLAV